MSGRVGQHLGNYRLVRLLGQGGFADVYLGEHVHLNSQAAIKILQVRLVGSALEQFRHEGRTIAHLIHPNIVRVFDFGVENGTPFLVMDYAPNGTLRQRYPKGVAMSLATVLPHFLQIARALQYAHDHKLIHRDIKPENMLLGPNNEVLLSDFGLVLPDHSTGSQTAKELAGTISYMAPEQIHGRPRSASDQYALGIVLYEWLSGDRPFRGSPMEIATQHLVTPPAPLYGKVPGLSRAVEGVLLQALAKDPQQRFDRIESFASALEQACKSVQAESKTFSTIVAPSYPSSQVMLLTPPSGLSQQTHLMHTPQDRVHDTPSAAVQLASRVSPLREAPPSPYESPVSGRPPQPVSLVTPRGTSVGFTGTTPPSRSAEPLFSYSTKQLPSHFAASQNHHAAASTIQSSSRVRSRYIGLMLASVVMVMLVLALITGSVLFLPKLSAAGSDSPSTRGNISGSKYPATTPSIPVSTVIPTPTIVASSSSSGSTYPATTPSTASTSSTPTPTITTTPTITPTTTSTPTPTVTPTTTPTGSAITNYVGTWQNSDPNTRDWVSVDITAQGNTLTAHFYGACTPTPCDAGSTSATYQGSPVYLHMVESFATRDFTLTLSGSILHVTTFTHFTDNSGRSDYTVQDDFHQ